MLNNYSENIITKPRIKLALLFQYILFCSIIIFNSCFAQPDKHKGKGPGQEFIKPITFEHHILPGDSISQVFVSYKINFGNLLFVKRNSHYTGGIALTLEVFKDDQIVTREMAVDSISITDYEKSNSTTDYLEGLMQFNLSKGDYFIQPQFTVQNTLVSLPLERFEIKIEEEYREKFPVPFIVYSEKNFCDGDSLYRMVNSNSSIPFSPNDYSLLFQVRDTGINELKVKLIQKEKTLFDKTIETHSARIMKPSKCAGNIVLRENMNDECTSFSLNHVSMLLEEGPVKIVLNHGEKSHEFDVEVKWFDKPGSLLNPEAAIERLELIENKKIVDSLLSKDKEFYADELTNYWKSKDPVQETTFNELMNEFYRRIDDANVRFKTTDNKPGAETDRGETLIKFGEPDLIDRNYSDKDNILEIWKYKKIDRQFVFADNTGLGNFILIRNE